MLSGKKWRHLTISLPRFSADDTSVTTAVDRLIFTLLTPPKIRARTNKEKLFENDQIK